MKKATKKFEATRSEAAQLDFDELHVMQSARRLYASLDKDNRAAWLELAIAKYNSTKPNGGKPPIQEWLYLLLEEHDPVTKYVYENEVPRKRDRLIEAVISTGQKWTNGEKPADIIADAAGKNKEYKKALGYWTRMTAHYCDEVSDAATLLAYTDAGVEEVIWHTSEDDRVCEECQERNGLVFKIDRIPPKPHWGCRCYVRPVNKNKERFKGGKNNDNG